MLTKVPKNHMLRAVNDIISVIVESNINEFDQSQAEKPRAKFSVRLEPRLSLIIQLKVSDYRQIGNKLILFQEKVYEDIEAITGLTVDHIHVMLK